MKELRFNSCGVALLVAATLLWGGMRLTAIDKKEAGGEGEQTLTGEIVDLMCFLDHGAKGEKHRECAQTCIRSGGPVGILVEERVYLVVGDHKPVNDRLVDLAAKIVTLKGKVVERAGMRMIENVEIVKK